MYKDIIKLSSFHMGRGGRRSGQERRRFAYSNHIPERRLGKDCGFNRDRRSGRDRRKGSCDRLYSDLVTGRRFERRITNRYFNEKQQQSGFCLRNS